MTPNTVYFVGIGFMGAGVGRAVEGVVDGLWATALTCAIGLATGWWFNPRYRAYRKEWNR
jgi:hypothetical protein